MARTFTRFLLIMALLALAGLAITSTQAYQTLISQIVRTQHGETQRADLKYSSAEIRDIFENRRDSCKQIVVAACMRYCDPITCEPKPHVKGACQINGETPETGLWLVGIIGAINAPPYA